MEDEEALDVRDPSHVTRIHGFASHVMPRLEDQTPLTALASHLLRPIAELLTNLSTIAPYRIVDFSFGPRTRQPPCVVPPLIVSARMVHELAHQIAMNTHRWLSAVSDGNLAFPPLCMESPRDHAAFIENVSVACLGLSRRVAAYGPRPVQNVHIGAPFVQYALDRTGTSEPSGAELGALATELANTPTLEYPAIFAASMYPDNRHIMTPQPFSTCYAPQETAVALNSDSVAPPGISQRESMMRGPLATRMIESRVICHPTPTEIAGELETLRILWYFTKDRPVALGDPVKHVLISALETVLSTHQWPIYDIYDPTSRATVPFSTWELSNNDPTRIAIPMAPALAKTYCEGLNDTGSALINALWNGVILVENDTPLFCDGYNSTVPSVHLSLLDVNVRSKIPRVAETCGIWNPLHQIMPTLNAFLDSRALQCGVPRQAAVTRMLSLMGKQAQVQYLNAENDSMCAHPLYRLIMNCHVSACTPRAWSSPSRTLVHASRYLDAFAPYFMKRVTFESAFEDQIVCDSFLGFFAVGVYNVTQCERVFTAFQSPQIRALLLPPLEQNQNYHYAYGLPGIDTPFPLSPGPVEMAIPGPYSKPNGATANLAVMLLRDYAGLMLVHDNAVQMVLVLLWNKLFDLVRHSPYGDVIVIPVEADANETFAHVTMTLNAPIDVYIRAIEEAAGFLTGATLIETFEHILVSKPVHFTGCTNAVLRLADRGWVAAYSTRVEFIKRYRKTNEKDISAICTTLLERTTEVFSGFHKSVVAVLSDDYRKGHEIQHHPHIKSMPTYIVRLPFRDVKTLVSVSALVANEEQGESQSEYARANSTYALTLRGVMSSGGSMEPKATPAKRTHTDDTSMVPVVTDWDADIALSPLPKKTPKPQTIEIANSPTVQALPVTLQDSDTSDIEIVEEMTKAEWEAFEQQRALRTKNGTSVAAASEPAPVTAPAPAPASPKVQTHEFTGDVKSEHQHDVSKSLVSAPILPADREYYALGSSSVVSSTLIRGLFPDRDVVGKIGQCKRSDKPDPKGTLRTKGYDPCVYSNDELNDEFTVNAGRLVLREVRDASKLTYWFCRPAVIQEYMCAENLGVFHAESSFARKELCDVLDHIRTRDNTQCYTTKKGEDAGPTITGVTIPFFLDRIIDGKRPIALRPLSLVLSMRKIATWKNGTSAPPKSAKANHQAAYISAKSDIDAKRVPSANAVAATSLIQALDAGISCPVSTYDWLTALEFRLLMSKGTQATAHYHSASILLAWALLTPKCIKELYPHLVKDKPCTSNDPIIIFIEALRLALLLSDRGVLVPSPSRRMVLNIGHGDRNKVDLHWFNIIFGDPALTDFFTSKSLEGVHNRQLVPWYSTTELAHGLNPLDLCCYHDADTYKSDYVRLRDSVIFGPFLDALTANKKAEAAAVGRPPVELPPPPPLQTPGTDSVETTPANPKPLKPSQTQVRSMTNPDTLSPPPPDPNPELRPGIPQEPIDGDQLAHQKPSGPQIGIPPPNVNTGIPTGQSSFSTQGPLPANAAQASVSSAPGLTISTTTSITEQSSDTQTSSAAPPTVVAPRPEQRTGNDLMYDDPDNNITTGLLW